MTIKQRLKQLKKKYPFDTVSVDYKGSGDSFDSFWDVDSNPSTINSSVALKDFIEDADDLLWYAIEHSDTNFNNEGCEGTIIFDFVNFTLSIHNNHFVTETVPGDHITFENVKL